MMTRATPVIGLTGGIATGKSTIAAYLEQAYHWPLLDADVLAREAVRPGTGVLERIVERYGEGILHPEGHLNRAKLGERIFGNSQTAQQERRWLEEQIHPWIRERFLEAIAHAAPWPPLLLVVPLLFEAQMTDLVSEIWVVYCTPEQQKARLRQRDGYDDAQVRSRLEAQMPLSDKCERATLVLDNSGPATGWQQQIKQWLQQVKRVEQ